MSVIRVDFGKRVDSQARRYDTPESLRDLMKRARACFDKMQFKTDEDRTIFTSKTSGNNPLPIVFLMARGHDPDRAYKGMLSAVHLANTRINLCSRWLFAYEQAIKYNETSEWLRAEEFSFHVKNENDLREYIDYSFACPEAVLESLHLSETVLNATLKMQDGVKASLNERRRFGTKPNIVPMITT